MTVPRVRFHSTNVKVPLKNRRHLKQFLANLFEKEGVSLQTLDYVFCSDEELLAINQRFLHHDDLTDIITFNLSAGHAIEGEIYISLPRVMENARSFDTPVTRELHRVIFHGVLHLCGYRDKSSTEKKIMRLQEEKYLNAYLK